jgi:hypothetical protein
MPRADSTIRVNIIGDAKSLTKAADTAEGSVKGMNKQLLKVGGIVAGAFATREIIDFGQTALAEADRVGDAFDRIEAQLGPELAAGLRDRADDFHALGSSEGDMLELEARLIDIGTAAGIAADKLAPLAEDAAEVASAMALATDVPADEWIAKIGKAAASGDQRALRDLGINLDDAAVAARALQDSGKDLPEQLTEGELAAARQAIIIETLTARYGDVTTAGGDLESKQADIQAKFETLTGKIGEGLEGPLSDLLTWILQGIEGWEMFAGWLDKNADKVAELGTPLGVVADWLGKIVGLLQEINKIGLPSWLGTGSGGTVTFGGGAGPRGPGISTTTVNVQGGSPEAIEQAVRKAIYTINRHG